MWSVVSLAFQHGLLPVFTAFTIIFVGVHFIRRFFIDTHLRVNKNVRHSWTSIDSLSRVSFFFQF